MKLLPLKIAYRYLVAKKSTNAINIITGISVLGISIGTAALILVLSVFNGFEDLILSLFSKFNPDIKVTVAEGKTFEADTSLLARIDSLDFEKEAPKGSAQVIIGEATACIPLGSLIDVTAETARLTKAIGKVDADIERSQKKLGNEKFVANADPEVVATERERFEELKQQREQLTVALSRVAEAG